MARTSRPASDHLSLLARAAPHVDRLAPLALLRAAEARAHGLPRIGQSKLPSDDVVTLAQTPMMAFPAASLSAITLDGARPRIEGYWLGLTGPMGPLPLHLTEFAAYERRYAKEQPFGDFLDLAAARMLQFFYRAWSAANPAASVDRPDDDHFGDRIAALTGAEEGASVDSPFPARARLRYAALYISPRSATAICCASRQGSSRTSRAGATLNPRIGPGLDSASPGWGRTSSRAAECKRRRTHFAWC